jgi:predicted anti-sigma-YlaC factor YlaD
MSDQLHTQHCSQMLGNLSEYIDHELQAELCAEIEAHIKGCDNCRIVVNTLQKTVELYETSNNQQIDLPSAVRERLYLKLELRDRLK